MRSGLGLRQARQPRRYHGVAQAAGAPPRPGPQPQPERPHLPPQQADTYQGTQHWRVPRTPLHHLPPSLQAAVRSGPRRQPQRAASAGGAEPGAADQLAAAADGLVAVLVWEREHRFENTVGRTGSRFADHAAARLRQLAAELQALRPADRGAAAPSERQQGRQRQDPVQQCEIAALLLGGYAGAGLESRAALVQEALLAAEAAKDAALVEVAWQAREARLPLATPTAAAAAADTASLRLDSAAAAAHEEETSSADVPRSPGSTQQQQAAQREEAAEGPAPGGSQADAVPGGSRRALRPETAAFRRGFAEAAVALEAAGGGPALEALEGGAQRTEAWLALRKGRLTASAFSKALGFFPGDREDLWEEKVGLRAPFAGNAATQWGTLSEARALEAYQRVTGQAVAGCMFRVQHDDPPHGWLGASPDGLIESLQVQQGLEGALALGADPAQAAAAAPGPKEAELPAVQGARGAGLVAGPGPGILEVKCPYNKGHPELAVPPEHAIWYYMPQVQGLMDIFDREWCNLYVWTPAGGSALFHVRRDRAYWEACFEVLAEFWWAHVVPARQAAGAGRPGDAEGHRPSRLHAQTEALKAWSKRMALAAPATHFRPEATSG